MLLGFHTSGMQNHRLDEALRLLADRGYAAVAITPDVMHHDPWTTTRAELAFVRALLERLQLQPVIETGARYVLDPARKHEPTLMTRSGEGRARRLDYYRRCAGIGRQLGARVMSFFSGVDRAPGPDAEPWLDEGVRLTCELVRGEGLVPALEPEPGMAIDTVAAYRALCDRLGADAPRLCLDVGHLYVTGEGAPDEIIAARRHDLAQVHLEDMRRSVHEHLPPGSGDVDFQGVRQALAAAGYAGAVCFELSRSSHMAPEALELCRRAWTGG
jgi:sugar phosphate isomerase/epimerase